MALASVLSMRIQISVAGPVAGNNPASIANGPTPTNNVAAILSVANNAFIKHYLKEKIVNIDIIRFGFANDGQYRYRISLAAL